VVGQGGSWPLLPVVPRTTKFFARGSAPIPLSGFHCVRPLVCVAGARPLGARSPRAETPPAPTQQCGPGWGPSVSAYDGVTDTPPRIRTLGTPWRPEKSPLAPARRNLSTHPEELLIPPKQNPGGREGGGEIRPAGRGAKKRQPPRSGKKRAISYRGTGKERVSDERRSAAPRGSPSRRGRARSGPRPMLRPPGRGAPSPAPRR
jgi:hypothetical protein